jgi:hypothetical protein
MTPQTPKGVKAYFHALLLTGALAVLAAGCTTYQQQNNKNISYWQQGRLTNAVTEATKMAEANAKNKDAIIWRLEQGAVLRANGQYEDSNKAFDIAQAKIDEYAQAAKVKVGHEAGALLSNQAELPYTGRAYDGIMLNTYEALNFLALGEAEKARPEIIRAYQRQQDAVEANKKRIEQVEAEAAESTNSATIAKAQKDPKFQTALQSNYTVLENVKPYADFVNPFTVYVDGLYFMANAADASDLERAHKSLERVQGFIGDNPYIKQDLAATDDLINGKPLPPTTYVIFETGCAPERGQIRIDIPIFVSDVPYVGAAFPTLQMKNNYVPSLTAVVDGTNAATTMLLASMDSVIALDFKNELPTIITKTIASTVTKAVAAYAVNHAASQQSDIGGFFTKLVTSVYQAAVNISDTRTWTTLPKEFQFCRIPTPPDRKISLSAPNGLGNSSVTIRDGTINLIYVKSINANTPLLVEQMKLK